MNIVLKLQFLLLYIFSASVSICAKALCVVPNPAEYQSNRGTFKPSGSADIYVSASSGINRDLARQWLGEMGISAGK